MFLERWNIPPVAGGSIDQPFTWIDDIIRYINLRDAIEDEDGDFIHAAPDAYEPQVFEDDNDIARVSF